jgi:protein SCO1/2
LKRLATLVALLLLSLSCRGEPPPVSSQVPDFSLTDQHGQPASLRTLAGKPWVAAFMFTRCPTICPRITARMKALQQQAKQRSLPLVFVSFSVDPEHDTPAVLKDYATKQGADQKSWLFLTGDITAIKRTSVEGFKLALDGKADAASEDYGILHGSHLVLVDGSAGIRGYYATNDDAAMKKLLDDAARLD